MTLSPLDWFKVPRDLETVSRSLQRKLWGLDSKSSYPLLSGDTFKYRCGVAIEGQIAGDYDFHSLQGFTGKIFVQAKPMSNATDILVNACKSGMRFLHSELVIHNGDVIPSPGEMLLLSQSFKNVHSVNWLGSPKIASPLPIGLENRDKRRNGVPVDYLKEIEKGLPEQNRRDISLLVCFSLHTNIMERSTAIQFARDFPGVKIVTDPITPRQYRKLLLRSRFVLSPPGNGPDCHRTWEALYLGAIPVVLQKSWPFQDYDVPALVLQTWDQITEIPHLPKIPVSNSWKIVENWLA